ncbi:MAG: hypothetical protein ACK5LY_03225 [Lachnospirales bacterium]
MKKYILSVDGGNSKTDYLLTDTMGNFVFLGRYGTCSHEQFKNGYEGMFKAMKEHLCDLFCKNNIDVSDILHCTFGLAGCDMPSQHKKLSEKIKLLGFNEFSLYNDALLGLYAISDEGVGVCSVCGTGTVTLGINEKKEILQVGGIGTLTQDFAGGAFLSREVIGRCYEYYFRCGKETILTSYLEKILNIKDFNNFYEILSDSDLLKEKQLEIIQSLDKAVLENDFVAVDIMKNMAKNLGYGTLGCIKKLGFTTKLEVVLIGSIWKRLKNNILFNDYKEILFYNGYDDINFVILDTPPVIGGIFNSIKILKLHSNIDYKKELKDFLTIDKYDEIIKNLKE